MLSMSEWWFWEVVACVAGLMGTEALAAHSIAYALVPCLVMVPLGVSIAISVRVGTLLGEGEAAKAKAVASLGLAAGMFLVCTYALMVFSCPEHIINQFAPVDKSREVHALTRSIWNWVSCFLLLDGLMILQSGVLRGLGLQLRMSIATFLALWAIGLPAAWLVAITHRGGVLGLWQVLVPSYIVLNVFLALSYLSVDWGKLAGDIKAAAQDGPVRGPAVQAIAAVELSAEAGGEVPIAKDMS